MNTVLGWFRHNLWYKLVALVLSVALWTYVATRLNPLITAEVALPVDVEKWEEGVVVPTKVTPETVRVPVRGRQSVVQRLQRDREGARLVAYLTGLGSGENQPVPVEPTDLPPGVRADWDAGPVVSVTLEAVVERDAEVSVLRRGSPPRGYRVVTTSATPTEVTIRGPKSEIEAVAEVVVSVSVSTVTETTETTEPVRALRADNSPANVEAQPPEVKVHVEIAPAPRKTVPVVVSYGSPPNGYVVAGTSAEPSEVTIVSRGGDLSAITSIATETVSLSSVTDTTTRTVGLRAPRAVSIEGARTVKVTIRIRRRPAPAEEVAPPSEEASGGEEERPAAGGPEEGGETEPPPAPESGEPPAAPGADDGDS